MNNRKQHVMKMAHQLFVEKGFQNTSIQDILDYSGISKGTFYNYFSSKNELLIALLKAIYQEMEVERNELLIGQSPSNQEIFIQQVELIIRTNRTNHLISLFEEIFVSKDEELSLFLKEGQLKNLEWLHSRLGDIFGKDKKEFLLDSAIMFMGILQSNLKFFTKAYGIESNPQSVVHYSFERISTIIKQYQNTDQALFPPNLLNKWLPNKVQETELPTQKLRAVLLDLKKELILSGKESKYTELIDFLHEELLHSQNPRMVLIESSLLTLTTKLSKEYNHFLSELESLIQQYSLVTK
ncbi:TetR/AcrR family transcriptional regulator [Bacillus sp. AK128]